jgi:5-methylcytosine-specific restriction endonuclease McrBC regulatory subunit McrC
MERVFESALFNAIDDASHHEARRTLLTPFSYAAGAPAHTITLKPDIVVGTHKKPRIVVDAKWAPPTTSHHGSTTFVNADLYQLVTYALALGCPGVLVYPQFAEPIDVSYTIGGVRIGVRTVNLATPNLAALHDIAADLAAV